MLSNLLLLDAEALERRKVSSIKGVEVIPPSARNELALAALNGEIISIAVPKFEQHANSCCCHLVFSPEKNAALLASNNGRVKVFVVSLPRLEVRELHRAKPVDTER
jgi:hypothetical protein